MYTSHTQLCIYVHLPHTVMYRCTSPTHSCVSMYISHTQLCMDVHLPHTVMYRCTSPTHSYVSMYTSHTQLCIDVHLSHTVMYRCTPPTHSDVSTTSVCTPLRASINAGLCPTHYRDLCVIDRVGRVVDVTSPVGCWLADQWKKSSTASFSNQPFWQICAVCSGTVW